MCGLDPKRLALTGAEMRPCWAAPDPVFDEPLTRRPPIPVMASSDHGGRRPRTFVPVDELVDRQEPVPVMAPSGGVVAQPSMPGWSLWGDPDP